MATYYATKAYVVSFTRSVAEELRMSGSNVYVGCVCPGPVDTEFNKVAKVNFTLPSIRPDYCVKYALKQMKKRKVVIIPTMWLKICMTLGRLLPIPFYLRIAAGRQSEEQ